MQEYKPLDINNLSLKSLEKYRLVLDDIKFNMEIQNKTKYLDMGELEGIEGVPKSEHQNIMNTLLNDTDLIDAVHRNGDDFALDINVEKFERFSVRVSERIAELKGDEVKEAKKQSEEKAKAYDMEKGILHIGKYEVRILRRGDQNFGHFVLKHIFTSPEGISEEFPYKEIWQETINDKESDFNPRTYSRACENIQTKVSQDTEFAINDFLIFDSVRVKINPKYLDLKQK